MNAYTDQNAHDTSRATASSRSMDSLSWDGALVDPSRYVNRTDDGWAQLHLVIENIECPACVNRIERTLLKSPEVKSARVNLTTSRLVVDWDDSRTTSLDILQALDKMGFTARPFDPKIQTDSDAQKESELLQCLGVAGFAAANVMLISVSVWAGLVTDMGEGTRALFHWISALIVLPAVAFAGRPFFRSALRALRARHLNMDVPISLAVLLACGMSLAETIVNADHVFFDAAAMLLFFLLIGRYLDRRARGRARSAAQNLLSLQSNAATVLDPQGRPCVLPVAEIEPGMTVLVSAGAQIPVDGVLMDGQTTIDTSAITGESLPRDSKNGDQVFAGTINLSAPVRVRVTKPSQDTLLSKIVTLMEEAEKGRASYVRLADRAAQIYAPAVHSLALITFLVWWLVAGIPWQESLFTAIAVLIITCPCALALAVPVVQVVAVGQLLKNGVLVKSVEGLEKLAAVDTVVFDKTGTLTAGRLSLVNGADITPEDFQLAASLAAVSKHPLSRALAQQAQSAAPLSGVVEHPGEGLIAEVNGEDVRLGNRLWCGVPSDTVTGPYTEIWLRRGDKDPVVFLFQDELRSDAADTVRQFAARGMHVELLSGDREDVVAPIAQTLAIRGFEAEVQPQDKIARIQSLRNEGRRVLMVGDGINDAPALAAADVSLSPSSASDVSQAAADFVFQGIRLDSAVLLHRIAVFSKKLIMQNFGLALLYNLIAIPLAMLGYVTPLVAALAMSASSLLVTANSMRLTREGRQKR